MVAKKKMITNKERVRSIPLKNAAINCILKMKDGSEKYLITENNAIRAMNIPGVPSIILFYERLLSERVKPCAHRAYCPFK